MTTVHPTTIGSTTLAAQVLLPSLKMRNLLKNCLLLLFLLIISITDVKEGFQIICADKSPHCKRRSDMCQSNAFHSVMQSVCKKTCGLCEDNPKSDILDQYRHKKESDIEVVDVEDGEDKDNFEYSESETTTDQVEEEGEGEGEGEGEEEIVEELLATLSSTVMPHSVTKNWKQTVCVDSSTDCEGKRYLCNERMYAYLMRRECPRTCGLCHSGLNVNNLLRRFIIRKLYKDFYKFLQYFSQLSVSFVPIKSVNEQFAGYRPGTPNQIVDGITKDVTRCRDVAPDCNQSLCNHRTYRPLMQTVCKRTCSSCHLDDT
ncbi:unnamed protein product [Brugia pahangi]|uniref:ShKT domain-containing protein n=1 Tax=Brugia pahangi TaxID=6280 RepID=A0A0N4SYN4_BRUPA|nr:unnamed protein product [Brugia pahangi]